MERTLLVLCVAAVALAVAADKYPDYWDSVNVDEVLHNDRLRTQYLHCLLGQGSCSKEGEALKSFLPDALRTGCERCTDKQKKGAVQVIRFLSKHKPSEWQRFVAAFDPSGEFRGKYEPLLKDTL